MGGLIDANEHAVNRRTRRHSKCHGDMTTRLGSTVISNWPSYRQIGGYDDVLDHKHTRIGSDPPALAGLDLGHASVFEYPAARCFDRLCEADEVLRGIKLCLIRKPQGRGRLERQRCPGEHLGVEANPKRSLGFGHDLITPCWITRIGVGVLRLEVACDIKIVYPLADLLNASSVGFGVAFCQVDI